MFKRLVVNLFFHSWWVIGFILFCAILFEQGLKGREANFNQLKTQLLRLQMEKKKGVELQQSLERQIHSQSDLAWQEITLMKELGLVPENDRKILFYRVSSEI